jgi:hypothetical protein
VGKRIQSINAGNFSTCLKLSVRATRRIARMSERCDLLSGTTLVSAQAGSAQCYEVEFEQARAISTPGLSRTLTSLLAACLGANDQYGFP